MFLVTVTTLWPFSIYYSFIYELNFSIISIITDGIATILEGLTGMHMTHLFNVASHQFIQVTFSTCISTNKYLIIYMYASIN